MIKLPSAALPIPPFEMRQLVGCTDEADFDNPSGAPILNVPEARFDAVLDFGCGCGRLARQMLQQRRRPRRYVGVDLHAGMIRWCRDNLATHAPGFSFLHHDVYNPSFNPDPTKPPLRPIPAEDGAFSLLIALSVFTHTTEAHAEYYLQEAARVLRSDGEMTASFFLFEKRFFPMMQDFQNALYINIEDPWNAVIFDREWLETRLADLGLGVVRVQPPNVRGFQWVLHIRRLSAGEPLIPISEDRAPFGRMPSPTSIKDPSTIGQVEATKAVPAVSTMIAPFRLAIFTICSNNYIPAARTFLKSAQRHHPDAGLFICLVDRMLDVPALYDPDWSVIEAENLRIPDFRSFSFRYDIMELNTAVKPYMFRHLLEELDYDVALYFDPDIEIFRPLEGVLEKLRSGASLVLTPHLCAPSEGSDEPNDITIMRAGIYNLGFLGVARGEESGRIIDWWSRRLRFECISAQEDGIFVDQRFMDLVPGFGPQVHISHDTTLNVAYWNLRQRRLEQDDFGWTVDGERLTFFHYSGFDPHKPSRLSKYDASFDDIMPEPLRRLIAGYAKRLLDNGYGTISGETYAYGRFSSGTAIHPLVRRMFREWHRFWPDDPFETYEAFLNEPWPGAYRRPDLVVTNFMKFLHGRFPHLSTRLDLSQPAHARELVDWFVARAATELRLDLRLTESAASRSGLYLSPQARALPKSQAGADVTVVGYLRTASGVGEVGRQTLLTLAASGLTVEGYDVALNVAAKREDESCATFLCDAGTAPVQIFNVNADQLRAVVHHTYRALRCDAVRINIPFWELSQFPSVWLTQFADMDEIWAPSRFIQTAIAGKLDKPVIYMPVAIELQPPPSVPRERFGLPSDRFLFFYAFDFLSFVERKNPRGAVAAFRTAFPYGDHAGLVLKCMNGAMVPEKLAAFRKEIGRDKNIFLVDATLNRTETLGLIAATNAVISLHRSEGLGLLIAEAMLLGKPVIATDYSASREFVNDATGYPVGYQLVPVRDGEYPFFKGQVWADPDVEHAAWLMRRLCEEPSRAGPLVAQATLYLRQHHSRVAVGHAQAARLRLLLPLIRGV